MPDRECPFCGSTRLRPSAKAQSHKWGIREIMECESCGLYFLDPMPTRNQLDEFYTSDYFLPSEKDFGYASYLKGNAGAAYHRGQVFGRKLKRLFPGNRVSLLEVGCSTGHFLKGASETEGIAAAGVEISKWAADYAKNKLGMKVSRGTLEEAAFPSQSFDVIYAEDVLEHERDPLAFLHECRRILSARGKIFLRLSNGPMELKAYRRAGRRGQTKTMLAGHLYFFGPDVLAKFMRKSGLRIERLRFAALRSGLNDLGVFPHRFVFSRVPADSVLRPIAAWKANLFRLGHELEITAVSKPGVKPGVGPRQL